MEIIEQTKETLNFLGKKNTCGLIHGQDLLSVALQYEMVGNVQHAIVNLRKAQKVFKTINCHENSCVCWNLMSRILLRAGKEKEALECLKRVVKVRKKMKNPLLLKMSYEALQKQAVSSSQKRFIEDVNICRDSLDFSYYSIEELLKKETKGLFSSMFFRSKLIVGSTKLCLKVIYNCSQNVGITEKTINLEKGTIPLARLPYHPNIITEMCRFTQETPYDELGNFSNDFKEKKVSRTCGFVLIPFYKKNLRMFLLKLKHGECLFDDEKQLIYFMKKLLSAVEHLNKYKIIHGGLCPQAILLDENNIPSISCFEKSRDTMDFMEFPDVSIKKNSVTTPYQPPEFKSEKLSVMDFTKYDSYSMGVIFYEIITGESPFANGEYKEIFNHRFSATLLGIVKKLVDPNPLKRLDCFKAKKLLIELLKKTEKKDEEELSVILTKQYTQARKIDKRTNKAKESITLMELLWKEKIAGFRQEHLRYEAELQTKDKIIKEMEQIIGSDRIDEIQTKREIFKRAVDNLSLWVNDERASRKLNSA